MGVVDRHRTQSKIKMSKDREIPKHITQKS